ncbi:MAG: response regulator [Gemmatimonadetes bacterium]|nr:response regulator [Gemmatimonadota bacterium]
MPNRRPSDGSTVAAFHPLIRGFADAVETGVLLLDAEGRVRYVNPSEAARWGEAAAPLAGRDFFRELAPVLERSGEGARYRAATPSAPVEVDTEAEIAGGSGARTARILLRSVWAEGTAWGVVLLEDRTALAAEQERRRNAERMASIGQLAAGLAHEVNNPLASIRSFAQLLIRDAASDSHRHALELIVAECDRITTVMDRLVSMIRNQGGDSRTRVDLNVAVHDILETQRYALASGGIEVRTDLQEPLSPVAGDPGALQQMVLELVLHAERALAKREGTRLLVIRSRETSRGISLAVYDNGPGVPRDHLSRIFTAGESSAGLGLSVAAGIVRDHFGEIWMESEEGRNTTLVVELPRAGEIQTRAQPRPQVQATGAAPSPQRPLHVLLADDEATLRMALRMYLERRGHRVTTAADAEEAWTLANQQEFDVALVDARMPGDGVRLLERLEELPSLAGRTALMTGDLGRVRERQGVSTGRPALTKPFKMEEMVRLLETLGLGR